jgi:RNA polymerase sigma-70 factor (ECF subfamily)
VINWQNIIEQHGRTVWQAAYRLVNNHEDASDCYQEAFVNALDISKTQEIGNFRALLVKLVTARALDRLRRKKTHNNIIEKLKNGTPDRSKDSPSANLENFELSQLMLEAIKKLKKKEAHIFCMRYLDDLSYSEIAETMNIKQSMVGVILHRTRSRLKKILD